MHLSRDWGLYSPPCIPPGIPLESQNSTGLILEFDILTDCGWKITGMVFYLLCLVGLYWVPLDSIKKKKVPWKLWQNSMGEVKFQAGSSCEIIYMWDHLHVISHGSSNMMLLSWCVTWLPFFLPPPSTNGNDHSRLPPMHNNKQWRLPIMNTSNHDKQPPMNMNDHDKHTRNDTTTHNNHQLPMHANMQNDHQHPCPQQPLPAHKHAHPQQPPTAFEHECPQ